MRSKNPTAASTIGTIHANILAKWYKNGLLDISFEKSEKSAAFAIEEYKKKLISKIRISH
nr:hypothetical protein [Olivibacter jilunii]